MAAADVDQVRVAVGRAVRAARVREGMSMRALATACGVSQAFLSAVERGLSTPSLATIYRLADVLGTEPASLLPPPDDLDVAVIRSHEGRMVPTSDRPNAALGRLVFSDASRHLEVYEYVATTGEDLDVWYEHPGDTVLHLIEGSLRVEFASRPSVVLQPGDSVVHAAKIAHRWTVEGDQPVRLFLVVVRREPVNRR